jgi:hypothetical protein
VPNTIGPVPLSGSLSRFLAPEQAEPHVVARRISEAAGHFDGAIEIADRLAVGVAPGHVARRLLKVSHRANGVAAPLEMHRQLSRDLGAAEPCAASSRSAKR